MQLTLSCQSIIVCHGFRSIQITWARKSNFNSVLHHGRAYWCLLISISWPSRIYVKVLFYGQRFDKSLRECGSPPKPAENSGNRPVLMAKTCEMRERHTSIWGLKILNLRNKSWLPFLATADWTCKRHMQRPNTSLLVLVPRTTLLPVPTSKILFHNVMHHVRRKTMHHILSGKCDGH